MFVFWATQEVHGHVADGGHVLRPGAGPEPDRSRLMSSWNTTSSTQCSLRPAVLDMPVAAHGTGEQLGVERQGRQLAAPLQAGAAIALNFGLDPGDGAQAREAWLAGKPPGVRAATGWR